jgi:hypothetical protein
MTHDQIVVALQRGYQLDDARESRRGCYPIRKPSPRETAGPMAVDPRPLSERVGTRIEFRRWSALARSTTARASAPGGSGFRAS